MYYIYHIPNVKIGCTKNPKRRLQQQGYSSFEILETHDCIDSASVREQELQKEYGYKVDTSTYKESVQNIPIGKQHIGGSAALKSQWKNDYDRMVKQARKAAKKGRDVQQKKTLMCDLEGKVLKEFNSRSEAAKYVNGNKANVMQCIVNPHYTYRGYKWKNKD
tara:strand:- start:79 stop:567 length:489 start_codon:yes stop_codon:yes gene_type:complete